MKATHLACKGCGATYPLEAHFACDTCFGPLEVGWDESQPVPAARIAAGPRTLWRFADFLPVAPPERGLPAQHRSGQKILNQCLARKYSPIYL